MNAIGARTRLRRPGRARRPRAASLRQPARTTCGPGKPSARPGRAERSDPGDDGPPRPRARAAARARDPPARAAPRREPLPGRCSASRRKRGSEPSGSTSTSWGCQRPGPHPSRAADQTAAWRTRSAAANGGMVKGPSLDPDKRHQGGRERREATDRAGTTARDRTAAPNTGRSSRRAPPATTARK